MILQKMDVKHYKGFRFEACWLRMEGFREKLLEAGLNLLALRML